MARRSQHEHLKPEIWAAFSKGAKPKDAIERFGVPSATAYIWFRDFQQNPSLPNRILESFQNSRKNLESYETVDSEFVPLPHPPQSINNALAIQEDSRKNDSSNLTNFQLAEKTLRAIASDEDQPGAVRVQACLGLMRLIQMQVELPKHILEGKEQDSVASERKKLEGMSAEELAREYKAMIDGTYH
jgi:hypothetical protein